MNVPKPSSLQESFEIDLCFLMTKNLRRTTPKKERFHFGVDTQISPPLISVVDLEIMKGIAQSGVMKPGQPTILGLYLPRQELVRCTNLPSTSSEYNQAKQFTRYGLSRVRLEEFNEENLVW